MNIIKADILGMCFGVRDALGAMTRVENPDTVTIHGELVHNEQVLVQLRSRGFQMVGEDERDHIPETGTVMITAHGISNKERQRLIEAGKTLVDTTCPLVHRAHQAAQKLQDQGFHVLVIGKRGHVEVQGIVEDLHSYDIISIADEVATYPYDKLGVMCQTTSSERLVREIRQAIDAKNPHAEIRFIDTVCHPTKDHQKALEVLIDQVDAMVVVGGKNSNNTKQLKVRCEERGIPAFHVQGPEELRKEWFVGVKNVGLTAGTSTLDSTINEVHEALVKM
ncbi:MAG: 4-hydroxy-3-methylbut-2-enyl diphosphate reductase [Gemmataceae bacterium]